MGPSFKSMQVKTHYLSLFKWLDWKHETTFKWFEPPLGLLHELNLTQGRQSDLLGLLCKLPRNPTLDINSSPTGSTISHAPYILLRFIVYTVLVQYNLSKIILEFSFISFHFIPSIVLKAKAQHVSLVPLNMYPFFNRCIINILGVSGHTIASRLVFKSL